MRYLIILFSLFLSGCADVTSLNQNQPIGALASKPLYRDPVFDGAADPSIIFSTA